MNVIGKLLQSCIRAYQLVLSPLLGASCRFHPSCSAYAIEAIGKHGPLKGTWLGVCRIIRCNPWGSTGNDPVPPVPHSR